MNIHSWVQTSPQLKLLYMLVSFAVLCLTLWGMEKLHDHENSPGTRKTPKSFMKALRLCLAFCATTMVVQFAMPSEHAGRLPDGVLALLHLRVFEAFAMAAYFIHGAVELCRPHGLYLRQRAKRDGREAEGEFGPVPFPERSERPNQPMHRSARGKDRW